MMEKNNIDHLFRNKLHGHQPAYQPAHWGGAETLIKAQGNSGSLLFWSVAIGLAVLTTLGFTTRHFMVSETGLPLTTDHTTLLEVPSAMRQSNESLPIIAAGPASPSSTSPSLDIAKTSSNHSSDNQQTTAQNNPTTKTQNQPNDLAANESHPKHEQETTEAATNNDAQAPSEQLTDETPNVTDNVDRKTGATGMVRKENELVQTETPPPSELIYSSISEKSDSRSDINPELSNSETKSGIPVQKKTTQQEVLSSSFISPLKAGMLPTIYSKDPVFPDLDLPELGPYSPPKWLITAGGGVLLSTPLIKGNEEFIAKRTAEEQSLPGIDIGVDFAYTPNRWSIGSGLHYFNINEVANYVGDTTETMVINEMEEFEVYTYEEMVIDSMFADTSVFGGGNGIWVYDTTFVVINDTTFFTTVDTTWSTDITAFEQDIRTQFSFIEIPINVGYTLPLGEHTHLSLHQGLNIGILSATTGSYITTDMREVQTHALHTRKILLTSQTRLRLSRSLGYRMQVWVEGNYRRTLNSLVTNQPFTQGYHLLGGGFGLGYRF